MHIAVSKNTRYCIPTIEVHEYQMLKTIGNLVVLYFTLHVKGRGIISADNGNSNNK
jgi:hypothetical protein